VIELALARRVDANLQEKSMMGYWSSSHSTFETDFEIASDSNLGTVSNSLSPRTRILGAADQRRRRAHRPPRGVGSHRPYHLPLRVPAREIASLRDSVCDLVGESDVHCRISAGRPVRCANSRCHWCFNVHPLPTIWPSLRSSLRWEWADSTVMKEKSGFCGRRRDQARADEDPGTCLFHRAFVRLQVRTGTAPPVSLWRDADTTEVKCHMERSSFEQKRIRATKLQVGTA
jgi:hypothetical protein